MQGDMIIMDVQNIIAALVGETTKGGEPTHAVTGVGEGWNVLE